MKRSARHASYLCVALIRLISIFSHVANAADVNPLRPVDTSSPRATLEGFVSTMDEIYLGTKDILQEVLSIPETLPHARRTAEAVRDTFRRAKGNKGSGSVRHPSCTSRYGRARTGTSTEGNT